MNIPAVIPAIYAPVGGAALQGTIYNSPVGDVDVHSLFGNLEWFRTFPHRGIDISRPNILGTPIINPFDGDCVETGYEPTSRGNYIIIVHYFSTVAWYFNYFHMDSPSVYKQGDTVPAQAVLGPVGTTGNSTGPHLHWEINDGVGNPVNPLAFFQRNVTSKEQLIEYLNNGGSYVNEGASPLIDGTDVVKILLPWNMRGPLTLT